MAHDSSCDILGRKFVWFGSDFYDSLSGNVPRHKDSSRKSTFVRILCTMNWMKTGFSASHCLFHCLWKRREVVLELQWFQAWWDLCFAPIDATPCLPSTKLGPKSPPPHWMRHPLQWTCNPTPLPLNMPPPTTEHATPPLPYWHDHPKCCSSEGKKKLPQNLTPKPCTLHFSVVYLIASTFTVREKHPLWLSLGGSLSHGHGDQDTQKTNADLRRGRSWHGNVCASPVSVAESPPETRSSVILHHNLSHCVNTHLQVQICVYERRNLFSVSRDPQQQ